RTDPFTAYGAEADLAIDFLPPADSAGYRTVSIPEPTIVAMYMNNRAAETLAQDRLDDAYWWARGAIAQDPGFIASYNTLGVIFRLHGQLEAARRAFAFALERAPADTGSMHNLAQALTALGEEARADVLRRKLAQLQPRPPFHFFERGRAAMGRGDYRAAALFSKEIERDPYYHEFHFWLAQAYFRPGQVGQAERQLTLAMEASGASAERALYAAKLDRLRALRTPH
ncbi:MAG TPA: hypothetical protein DCW29_02105, partial [Janthinobacterium sp.]|nr:hypothetical protein [Janthinobacterium sp.]